MTEVVQRAGVRSWHVPMRGRVHDEPHRTATPLELLFDLCFVVAVNVVSMQRERPGLPGATVMTDTPERSSGPGSSHGG